MAPSLLRAGACVALGFTTAYGAVTVAPKPAGAAPAAADPLAQAQAEFFQKRIAPIFQEACYKCHSNAEGKTKGGLALDSRDAILKGGDDGKVVIPGDVVKSMLLQRVISKDPEEKMPPKEAALTAQQVADLTAWIKMGAPIPATIAMAPEAGAKGGGAIAVRQNPDTKKHWAWQPIRVPAVPPVRNPAAVKTPVDSFIQAKLEQAQIAPNEIADRPTLIRRAYYDLVGLPPMPWEVQAFIDDKAPNAWEKVIDRLLSSPRYGERWGRFWLDVARYSDTKGESGKKDTPLYVDAWTYRDYVIDAFNTDKPFDRFIVEQIAADKLDLGRDKRPLAALGFLTLGDRFNGQKNDIINDRIDVVTKGFLGLTVSCARCHDHMFDPITQKDYYALHGIFASTAEPKENPIIVAQADAKLYQDYLNTRAAAEEEAKKGVYEEVANTRRVFRQHAGDLLMAGMNKGGDRRKYIEAIGLPAREVEELSQFVKKAAENFRRDPIFGPFAAFAALPEEKYSEHAAALAASIAGEREPSSSNQPKAMVSKKGKVRPMRGERGASINFPVNPQIAALFKGRKPQSLDEVAGYYTAFFKTVSDKPTAPAKKPAMAPLPLSSAVGQSPAAEAEAAIKAAPFAPGYPGNQDESELAQSLPQKATIRYTRALLDVRKVEITHPGAPRRAMAVEDAARPVISPVFIRGEANNKGELVPHRFLEILSGPKPVEFKNGSGRLELAQAIASRSNPLTPRVMVNRIWLHHFGEGIVTTPDDLGTMSNPPSHLELLDFLSAKFIQSNWSVKTMHKLIMLSAVYQRKVDTNDKFAAIDPANRLLWRYNMHRLDFEALRDTLLYISGGLDLKLGGQPVNILSEPYSNRRSVYGYIDRRDLPEMMNHFDFANPALPLGKRHETTVPQQALFMMNSPLMVDVARKLLVRPEMGQAQDDSQRVHALYWMIFQRPPKPEEIKLGLGFLAAAEAPNPNEATEADPASAGEATPLSRREMAKQQRAQKKGAKKSRYGIVLENEGEKVERKALSPWEKYTHALLMANETIYYN
jgi:hypothetical protein